MISRCLSAKCVINCLEPLMTHSSPRDAPWRCCLRPDPALPGETNRRAHGQTSSRAPLRFCSRTEPVDRHAPRPVAPSSVTIPIGQPCPAPQVPATARSVAAYAVSLRKRQPEQAHLSHLGDNFVWGSCVPHRVWRLSVRATGHEDLGIPWVISPRNRCSRCGHDPNLILASTCSTFT